MLIGRGIGVRVCGYVLKFNGKYDNDNWPGLFDAFAVSKNSEKWAICSNGT